MKKIDKNIPLHFIFIIKKVQ